jgi:antitoxin VapB
MERTRLFKSNRLREVRLPKDVAYPGSAQGSNVIPDDAKRVIAPANPVWDDFFDAPGVDMPPREQPRT